MENKTSKYFKYAIGEIILVVIGILIALQINNWNENRKLRNQEINYYCQLVDNLNSDLTNIISSTNSLDNRQKTAQRFLKNLLKNQEKKDVLLHDFLKMVRSKAFVPTRAAIEDITSSGKLEIIGTQVHKNAILDYYVQQDLAEGIIVGNRQQLFNQLFEMKDYTAFGMQELPEYREFYDPELRELLESSEWHKNSKNSIYESIMDYANMTIILCAREKEILSDIKYQAEELISLLESKCKNHKY